MITSQGSQQVNYPCVRGSICFRLRDSSNAFSKGDRLPVLVEGFRLDSAAAAAAAVRGTWGVPTVGRGAPDEPIPLAMESIVANGSMSTAVPVSEAALAIIVVVVVVVVVEKRTRLKIILRRERSGCADDTPPWCSGMVFQVFPAVLGVLGSSSNDVCRCTLAS